MCPGHVGKSIGKGKGSRTTGALKDHSLGGPNPDQRGDAKAFVAGSDPNAAHCRFLIKLETGTPRSSFVLRGLRKRLGYHKVHNAREAHKHRFSANTMYSDRPWSTHPRMPSANTRFCPQDHRRSNPRTQNRHILTRGSPTRGHHNGGQSTAGVSAKLSPHHGKTNLLTAAVHKPTCSAPTPSGPINQAATSARSTSGTGSRTNTVGFPPGTTFTNAKSIFRPNGLSSLRHPEHQQKSPQHSAGKWNTLVGHQGIEP